MPAVHLALLQACFDRPSLTVLLVTDQIHSSELFPHITRWKTGKTTLTLLMLVVCGDRSHHLTENLQRSLTASFLPLPLFSIPVATALLEALAAGGAASLAAPIVTNLGQICAGLSDEAEQLEQEAMQMDVEGREGAVGPTGSRSYASAAEAALGTAIR